MDPNRIIFKNLLAALAIKCQFVRYDADNPSEEDINSLIGAIYRKLDLDIAGYFPESGDRISRYVNNHGTIIKLEKKSNSHRAFAAAFIFLHYPARYIKKDEKIKILKSNNYTGFWEEISQMNLLDINDASKAENNYDVLPQSFPIKPLVGLEIINAEFWSNLNPYHQLNEKYRQFINDGNSKLAADLAFTNYLFSYDITQRKHRFLHNSEPCQLSLHDIVETSINGCVIKWFTYRSKDGKTSYLWHFITSIWKDVLCVWITNLKECINNLCKIDLKGYTEMIIFIDDQLDQLETEKDLLEDYADACKELGKKIKVITIISDNSINFRKYGDLYNQFRLSTNGEFSLNFHLYDFTELEIIYQKIFLTYKLDENRYYPEKHNFLRLYSNLFTKIQMLLNGENIQPRELKIWHENPHVKEAGLTHLYSLIAICSCLHIRFPIDYDSPKFLRGQKITDFFLHLEAGSLGKDLINIILIRNKNDGDYPDTHLVNYESIQARAYVAKSTLGRELSIQFFNELVGIIDKGNAKDCHAYVFRKLFRVRKDKSFDNLLYEKLSQTDAIPLFDKLAVAREVSDINKEKCLGSKAQYLSNKGEDGKQKAEQIWSTLKDKEGVSAYHQAKTLYDKEQFEQALDILNLLPIKKNFDRLRVDCYRQTGLIKKGLEYYSLRLSEPSLEYFEAQNFENCIAYALKRDMFDLVRQYLMPLHQPDSQPQNPSLTLLISRLIARLNHDEGMRGTANMEDKLRKITYAIQIMTNLISSNVKKSDQDIHLLAEMYYDIFDYNMSEKILDNGTKDLPNSIYLNGAYARFLLHRFYDERTGDLVKALTYINRNFAIFENKSTNPDDQAFTYDIYGKILEASGNYPESLRVLENFISLNQLNRRSKNQKIEVIFKHIDRLKK